MSIFLAFLALTNSLPTFDVLTKPESVSAEEVARIIVLCQSGKIEQTREKISKLLSDVEMYANKEEIQRLRRIPVEQLDRDTKERLEELDSLKQSVMHDLVRITDYQSRCNTILKVSKDGKK